MFRKNRTKIILDESRLVFCTPARAIGLFLDGARKFDYILVDEASKCNILDTLGLAVMGSRLILFGDPKQLPPTVKSKEAEKLGFGQSIMERLMKRHNSDCHIMLRQQFRMNQKIMKWCSLFFYGDKLIADESVKYHRLADDMPPMRWIDTANIDEAFDEQLVDTTLFHSKRNPAEAMVLLEYYTQEILPRIDNSETVGIITPYAGQVQLLRYLFNSKEFELINTEISTVDGFQGRECDVILISLVRSNPENQIGFIADPARLNVAITRAKKHVTIIGSSNTAEAAAILNGLLTYISEDDQENIKSPLEFVTLSSIIEFSSQIANNEAFDKWCMEEVRDEFA